MLFVGIDPGLTGACAVVGPQGLRGVFDLPTKPLPNVGPKAMVSRQIDGRRFAELLAELLDPAEARTAIMEDVQAMPGSAIQTMGSMMHSKGVLDGVLAAKGITVQFVRPQAWKKPYGLTADKGAARACCARLYPTAPVSRVKDHNRAEAILIAHYGRAELA
ncbi:hypothetical protein AVME950_02375 [Acidovorax sp. SUPP950]|uniref:hypothetical protein n=1 Tax=Acidovorax sp. SUPP950 TaxID=511901 RepID=UPI0023C28BFC|nr:hypothetical protein [Acidovorax sp. SUPP950]GKS73693.1 hypothetical protein AVME950_02375 [Acidovorax sp. SUPP950]